MRPRNANKAATRQRRTEAKSSPVRVLTEHEQAFSDDNVIQRHAERGGRIDSLMQDAEEGRTRRLAGIKETEGDSLEAKLNSAERARAKGLGFVVLP